VFRGRKRERKRREGESVKREEVGDVTHFIEDTF
jgi:hypothetical protein